MASVMPDFFSRNGMLTTIVAMFFFNCKRGEMCKEIGENDILRLQK